MYFLWIIIKELGNNIKEKKTQLKSKKYQTKHNYKKIFTIQIFINKLNLRHVGKTDATYGVVSI